MMEHKNMWQGPNVVVDKAGLVGRKWVVPGPLYHEAHVRDVWGIGCTAPPSSLSVLWLLVFLSSSGFSGAWFSDSWDESLSLVVSSRCFDSVEIGSVRGSSSLSSLRSSRAWPSTGYNAGTIQQNRFNKVPHPNNKLSHKNVERGIFGRLEIVTVLALIIGSSLD